MKIQTSTDSVQVVSQSKLQVSKDSIVTLEGEMVRVRQPIESCLIKDREVQLASMTVDSLAERLPYEDGASLDTLLNHRTVSLRSVENQRLFRLQHEIVKGFRQYLDQRDFVEIHTPKIIGAVSEGGANVFELKYFDQSAYLAQSPQLYKQMAIGADFGKVYEIGPVFRAENSNTHRHLTEFTGLDLEVAIERDYHEVLELVGDLMVSIFNRLQRSSLVEGYEEFKFLDKTLVIQHKQAVQMLRDCGQEIGQFDDFSTEQERMLGKLIRQKYHTDFYIIDKFPLKVRPFYTMPDQEQVGYSNSYDVYMRGEEIISGAQRIHDYNQLMQRVKDCRIDPVSIQSYLNSFRYGMPPHAGCGVGLERVLMLFLNLGNVRRASMFPRDPKRLSP